MNINFNRRDDLIDFLLETKEFNEWETIIFRISASNGMELNINTQINDPFGFREYTEFNKLKTMLNNFYSQNEHLSINLEIKFKFLDSLKTSIDPNNDFEAFHVSFFTDAMSNFCSISFIERNKQLNDKPIKSWFIYIINLYNDWEYKKNNR